MKQKVLYVITKGNWGGAQRYVFDMAVGARDAGFDVMVACGSSGALVERLREAGIPVATLPIENKASLGAILKAKRSIQQAIEAERPDIVHLNSSLIGIGGGLAARAARVRNIIYTDHGWVFKERRPLPVRALFWLASWITGLLVDRIIAVSDYELRLTKYLPFCARKAVRIYNGIDLGMAFGQGDIIRDAFPTGARITGTIGDLTKNKNQISLIEQAKADSSMHVAIVGEGALRPFLEQKVREYGLEGRVKLFGFLPAQDVMKGFDRFALPSIKEGLGYVILEARAAGLPIDANRVGGVSEALDRPLTGFSKDRMIEETLALYRS